MRVFVVMKNGHLNKVFDTYEAAHIYTTAFDDKDGYMTVLNVPVYTVDDLDWLTA